MPEIRCENKLFGYVTEEPNGVFESTCSSIYCGSSKQAVVRHRWDLGKLNSDGKSVKLIETKLFKRLQKGE